MFGCIRNIGCLVVLLVVVAAAWLFRDRWLPDRFLHPGVGGEVETVVWEPLTDAGADRAREAVHGLRSPRGPDFANIAPADLAAYVLEELSKELPPSAEHAEATARDHQLWVRMSVKLSDLGGEEALGPLAGVLTDREMVQLGGRLDVVRSGLGEFRVQALKVGHLSVPRQAIPRLLRHLERGTRPKGVAENALPLTIPSYIGDVRIDRGVVTIYRARR